MARRDSLGETERSIVVAAHLRADRSAKELAGIVRMQERTVRYHLHRLEQRGIIRKVPFINVYPLGLRYFNIYFSFSPTDRKRRQRIVQELKSSSKVSWIGELGGDYNLGFALIARSPEECLEFIEELSSKEGDIFLQKEVVAHRSLTIFSAKYLAPSLKSEDALGYGCESRTADPVQLDGLDEQIVKLLSKLGSLSIRTIAQHLGKPHPTIATRLKRLTQMEILGGEWYAIDVKRLGYQTLKLLIEVRSNSRKFKREISRYVAERPEFVYLIECLGKWDYEVGCDVPTNGSVSTIIDEFTDRFGDGIVSIKIVPMFKVIKWSLFP